MAKEIAERRKSGAKMHGGEERKYQSKARPENRSAANGKLKIEAMKISKKAMAKKISKRKYGERNEKAKSA